MPAHNTPPAFTFESGEFLRPIDVARKLGISVATVLRLLRKHNIPGFKFGRAWIIHRSSLQKLLEHLSKREDERPDA